MKDEHFLDLILIKRQFSSYVRTIKYLIVLFVVFLTFWFHGALFLQFSLAKSNLINKAFVLYQEYIDDALFATNIYTTEVRISGTHYYKDSAIRMTINKHRGNKVNYDLLTKIRTILDSSPIVANYSITRIKLRNLMIIRIKEQEIIGLYEDVGSSSQFFLLSSLALIKLSDYDNYAIDKDLIKIINRHPNPNLEYLHSALRSFKNIAQIDILENGRLDITLKNDILIKLPFYINQSLVNQIEEIVSKNTNEDKKIETIDCRVEKRIYLIFKRD